MKRSLLPWFFAMTACAGEGSGGVDPIDFTLQLRPYTPLDQADLFDDVASLTLAVDRPGSSGLEVHDLGAPAGDGTARTPEIQALSGAAVNVYGYDSGGSLVAYGRSSDWTLPDDEDPDVPILMARVGQVGKLTDLPGNTELVGGRLVADGAGRFVLFGGADRGVDRSSDGTPGVLRFDAGRPNTNLSFVRLDDLPAATSVNDTEVEGLAGHTALRLSGGHDRDGWVLVSGGANGFNGSSTVTDRMLLWNPDTQETVELGSEGRLDEGVYHHTADEFAGGFVALLGGAVGRDSGEPLQDGILAPRQSASLFEPRAGTVTEILTDAQNGPLLLHAAATLDGEAVIACGGLVIEGSSGEFAASDRCDRVDEEAILRADDTLPIPLMHHDMLSLPDGRILLTGGFTTTGVVGEGGSIEPNGSVYYYAEGEGWARLSDPLQVPRGMHSTALLPDGRVLIVGGATDISGALWDGGDATGCIEIYDPVFGASELVGTCDDDGQRGALTKPVILPSVASDPDLGVLVVGGADEDDDAVSQVAWFVGGIPEPE